jgi:3-hydroxyisobutyrate dehydrogenase
MASTQKIAFIGLGQMGRHMAANLLKKSHKVSLYDVNKESVRALVATHGSSAIAASSAAEAAKNSDIIITMLPSSPHVREVYEGSIFNIIKGSGKLLIDSSTIDPNVTKALAVSATKDGLRMVDAPVSGGVGGAEAGTLTFMVGGSKIDFDSAKVVLEKMGGKIVHCGDAGTGQIAKLCNNLILGISMNAVSEAMNLGVKLGADPKVLASIINSSSGRCWSSDTYNPVPNVMPNVPSSRGYSGGFGSALMAKDLGLAIDAARTAGVALPTGSAAAAVYALMMSQGDGEYKTKDFSSVYAFLAGNKV